jgi:hypothetical protein
MQNSVFTENCLFRVFQFCQWEKKDRLEDFRWSRAGVVYETAES